MCGLTRPRARATAHGTQPGAARSLAHLLPPPGSSPHLLCLSPSSPLRRLLPSSLCSSSSHRFRPPPTPSASPFSVATAAVAFAANPRCHRRFPPPLCFLTTSTAASFLSVYHRTTPSAWLFFVTVMADHPPFTAVAVLSLSSTSDLPYFFSFGVDPPTARLYCRAPSPPFPPFVPPSRTTAPTTASTTVSVPSSSAPSLPTTAATPPCSLLLLGPSCLPASLSSPSAHRPRPGRPRLSIGALLSPSFRPSPPTSPLSGFLLRHRRPRPPFLLLPTTPPMPPPLPLLVAVTRRAQARTPGGVLTG